MSEIFLFHIFQINRKMCWKYRYNIKTSFPHLACSVEPQIYHTHTHTHTHIYIHIIASWPNLKQWIIIHISDLIMTVGWKIDIITIIKMEKGKMKIHSPIHCTKGNRDLIWDTHLAGYTWCAFYAQCFCISLHNEDNEIIQCARKWMQLQTIMYPIMYTI